MSKSSKTSIRSLGRRVTRKKHRDRQKLLKPFGFCCDMDYLDPETRYDRRQLPSTSSFVTVSPIHESPTLKFRLQSTAPNIGAVRKKSSRGKVKPKVRDQEENSCALTRGPLLWYQEDEISVARNIVRSEKQRVYNEEAKKAVMIGKQKVEKTLRSQVDVSGPRWYQELSMSQLQHVLALGKVIAMDYEEWVTARTQQALRSIGVTSTFVQIPPPVIRKLQRASKLNPIEFLREIYRRIAGKYFEEEGHKKSYDCNEKIILSTIAILALPDTLVELNNRLPPIRVVVYPRKPKCLRNEGSRSDTYQSPYSEPIIGPIDWAAYRTSLQLWEEKCRQTPKPRVILPFLENNEPPKFMEENEMKIVDDTATKSESKPSRVRKKNVKKYDTAKDTPLRVPEIKETFDFAIDGLGDKSGTVEYKICGTLKPPLPKRKSWVGDKEAQYVVSGIVADDEPPECPVTYVMSGVAYVTPKNSDEEFFTELKLGERGRKIYPKGRKNLSRKWQEWLQDADEHFFEVEREANELIKSVEATMRLVMPEGRCDTCCSCRQTRKSNLKWHATKTPYMVIDSIAEGEDRSKYIVGSMAMHSPAPSLAESTVNLLEVVASKDEVQKKLIINGITGESGATTYYISGITEATARSKRTTSIQKHPPQPMRDVPTCQCTIERMFNEGLTSDTSDDNIPATKKMNVCFGHKYRPHEAPGYTCKEYPYDKSCRRNPFRARVNGRKKPIINDEECEECENPDCAGSRQGGEKFTLPTFVPCGDEDRMAVCAGPWGAKNIPDPDIVAAEDEERRDILRGPPCGDTPGRAVCGGEWGEKVAKPKVSKSDEDEDEESEDEDTETEEDAKESDAKSRRAKIERARSMRKESNRDKLCSVIPSVNDAAPKKSAVYCELDEPWNVARTAPTTQVTGIEYEKSLNLTPKDVPAQDSVNSCKLSTKRRKWNLKTGSQIERNPTTWDRKGKRSGPRKDTRENTATSESTKNGVKVIRKKNPPRPANDHAVANSKRRNNAKNKEQSPMSRNRGERKTVTDNNSTGMKSSEDSKHGAKEAGKLNVNRTKEQNRRMRGDGKLGCSNGAKNRVSSKYQFENKKEAGLLREEEREQDTQLVERAQKKDNALFRSEKKGGKNLPVVTSRRLLSEAQMKNASDGISVNTPRLLCRRESDNALVKLPSTCEYCMNVQSESSIRKDGPFGWRTKSQQLLPPEKTIVYLTERNSPVETIPLREGGRACKCRENRNKKKMLIYNIGGLVDDVGSRKRRGIPQVIEGVTFATPPPSPRVSDEYIPEYELYDSPFETCKRKASTRSLKHMQEYLGPRSLLPKKERNLAPCSCRNDHRPEVDGGRTKLPDKEQPKVPEMVSNEAKNPTTTPGDTSANLDRWKAAAKDKHLVDYFVRGHDSVPCWLTCSKFSHNPSKRSRLKVMKPVCECKYERKLVKREEEKSRWVERQRRLKSEKKQASVHVSGVSRPMRQDTKLMISSVKKFCGGDDQDEVTRYCVTGVAENYSMGPIEHVVSGTAMHSPLVTPEPSKTNIPCLCGHKHWSPMELREPASHPDDTEKDNFEPAFDQSDPNRVNLGCGGGLICKQKKDLFEISSIKRKLPDDTGNKIRNVAKYSKKSKISSRTAKNVTKVRETTQSIGANATRTVNLGNLKIPRSPVLTSKNYQASEDAHRYNDSDDDVPIVRNESDLFNATMIELKKMANEGFIFAKLPKCWLIPQVRAWIDYREGNIYSESAKKKSVDDSIKLWQLMDKNKLPDIVVPSFDCSATPSRQTTYDDMEKVKKQAMAMREKFLSDQRQIRVSLAQSYWKTMDFPRYPSDSFKKAYFTYLAAKETDGHLFRPWNTSEHKGR